MPNPVLNETGCNWALDPDNTTNPDLATTDWEANQANSWSYSDLAINTPIFIRLQVKETASNNTGDKNWQLYYNTTDNPSTATQVTTATSPIAIADDGGSSDIANGAATTARRCADPTGTWQNGEYTDASDASDKLILVGGQYTEFQFCITAASGASGNTYYFWLRFNGAVLDNYDGSNTATLSVAAATGLDATVTDNLTLSESVSASLDSLHASVTDNLTLSESVTPQVTGSLSVAVTDNLTLSDSVSVAESVVVETLEADPGYDLGTRWTETVGGTSTLDEDQATSGVTGSPADWGDDCLAAIAQDGENAYASIDLSNAIPDVWAKFDFIIDSHSMTDTESRVLAILKDSGDNDAALLYLYNDAGTLKLVLECYHDGASNSYTALSSVSLDTAYEVRIRWDATNDLWDWFLDGVRQPNDQDATDPVTASGLLTSTHVTNIHNLIIGILAGTGLPLVTAYFDNIKLTRALNVTAADALTVSETITPEIIGAGDLNATVTDNLTLSESVSAALDSLRASVTDNLTLSEATTAELTSLHAEVTDSLTLSGQVTATLDSLHRTVTDNLTLSESVSGAIDSLHVSVTDNLTLSEVITAVVDSLHRSVTDSLTLSETVAAELDSLHIAVVDSLTLSETVAGALDSLHVSVADVLTLSEQVTPALDSLHQAAADSLTLSEVVSGELITPLNATVTDTLTLAEVVTPEVNSLHVAVGDNLTLSETVAAALDSLHASVTDSLTLSAPVIAALDSLHATAADALTLSESIATDLTGADTLQATVSDSLTLSETITAALDSLHVAAVDVLTLSEAVAGALDSLHQSAEDGLALSEAVAAALDSLHAEVTDNLALSEAVAASLTGAETLEAVVTDTLILADAVSTYVTPLTAEVFDAITLTEQPIAAVSPLLVAVEENLSLSDAVSAIAAGAASGAIAFFLLRHHR